jgi:hypothetical protein
MGIELIGLLIGMAVFAAIVGRQEGTAELQSLEWAVNHAVRAPCRDCEETVVLDMGVNPPVWKHLRTDRVVSQTPYGQPHPAFPWPFRTEDLERLADQ